MPSNFNMVANTDPLAAALAAAAELAQNGGAYMYSPQTTNEIVFPIAIPQSPVTETMHEDDENDGDRLCEVPPLDEDIDLLVEHLTQAGHKIPGSQGTYTGYYGDGTTPLAHKILRVIE